VVSLKLFGTAITVRATVLGPFGALWAGITWWGLRRHPNRSLGPGLLMGLASVLVLVTTDVGHALAHIFSARLARAPMDEVRITAGMPRTLYWNNAVSPNQHRVRAMGGPVFNLAGLLLSLAVRRAVPRGSLVREVAGWSALGHGMVLVASLAPLPMVDGGTLLQWTLVAHGNSEVQADAIVRQIDRVFVGLGAVVTVAVLAQSGSLRRACGGRESVS
jgi:hypothetical protein